MMSSRSFPLFTLVFLFLVACSQTPSDAIGQSKAPENLVVQQRPKNIILMIGDGMGLTQITAGMYSNQNQLQLERLPYIGLHKSYASDNLVTDSAAGATAFACGKKTYNGAIGVDAKGRPCTTILEECEGVGMNSGLIATSTIIHATPASFVAHQPQRKMYEAIAADFLKVELDFFVGGGKKYFDRREQDDRDLVEELQKRGYVVSDYFQEEFNDLEVDPTRNFAYFTADDSPLPVAQGRDYLLPVTRAALEFLPHHGGKDRPFFLLVEGSQIDWGGHANDSDYIVSEMLDFDQTIGAVMDFAEQNGETLVIVTADHETGGYAINPGSSMDSLVTAFTSDYHTATLIPVFAYGPGAELFSGIYENTAIHTKMRQLLGFEK